MNEITINSNNGSLTVSSVQVATDFEKRHDHVIRDIEKLVEQTAKSHSPKMGSETDRLFIENSYTNERGRSYKSYEITRDGFSLLVMGFTGAKALDWKLRYIDAFNRMEQQIREKSKVSATDKAKALEVKEINARVRMSNQYLKLAKVQTISDTYRSILVAKSAEALAGTAILPLPESEQKMYSATEIAKMFNVSAQKIGRLANEHKLKTEEYGKWYHDKSPHSSKEVDTFRYNDRAIEAFRKIVTE